MPSLGTKTVYAEPGPPYKTAEQMTELCCEPRPKLQCREKVVGDIQPDTSKALENLGLTLDANGRDQNGRLVKLVYKERKNPCGKIVHRYKIEQKNCCDEVEELAWNDEETAKTVTPGGRAYVTVTGGRLPMFVKVRGNGFTLDGYNLRDGWVYGRSFWIYAADFACGYGPITVDDGCSVLKGGIRSTLGGWVYRVLIDSGRQEDQIRAAGARTCGRYVGPLVTGPFRSMFGPYCITDATNSGLGLETRDFAFSRDSFVGGLWGGHGTPETIYIFHPYYPTVPIPAETINPNFGPIECAGGELDGQYVDRFYFWRNRTYIYEWVC